MIYVGTSGFSFRDWVGPFYPPATPPVKMLEHYVQHFAAVEINSTYYRLPDPRVFEGIAARTPRTFRITVKTPAAVTHARTREPAAFQSFLRVLEPLERAGKLHGALAQFPFGFRNTPENQEYLHAVRSALPGVELFVEFRHDSWDRDETFALLRDLELGFVSVDEPHLPGLFPARTEVTGPVAYVRLHGRNSAQWWSGDRHRRYDYLYTDEELREWARRIHRLSNDARDTFVFFNNCYGGSAAQNAGQMNLLLGQLQDLDEGM
jgi:uncharacterized protein YecE (DUF72 family)